MKDQCRERERCCKEEMLDRGKEDEIKNKEKETQWMQNKVSQYGKKKGTRDKRKE